ncbi:MULTISPECIES: hypothetical protein [Lysinibacillus]|uniref:Uncharacterized protein n=1 Tax=Lysinibacillus antri TaxID=2498145 RepID=A0A3S0P898_9BACI|nr:MULTISPECIES: hypothetical protein [Lysinibacillus]RUL53531.1 hypothetical protein EK386_08155 [Lysinibacillus antri]TSI06238.1 hypothetical protein FJQ64_10945 [Lysinibacillus sp. BW-2-10]
MNRYLTLIVLVLLYSFCSHIIYDHPQAIDEQQIHLVDDQNSDYPIDDNGKFKDLAFIPQAIFVMIILSVTNTLSLFATFTRRLMLLTTIFYQSNYLIHSLK